METEKEPWKGQLWPLAPDSLAMILELMILGPGFCQDLGDPRSSWKNDVISSRLAWKPTNDLSLLKVQTLTSWYLLFILIQILNAFILKKTVSIHYACQTKQTNNMTSICKNGNRAVEDWIQLTFIVHGSHSSSLSEIRITFHFILTRIIVVTSLIMSKSLIKHNFL